MRRNVFVALIMALVLLTGCESAKLATGAMVDKNTTEVRLGVESGPVELYAAPRYDTDKAESGDIITDVRGYIIYNAIDANAVASFLHTDVALPPGSIYGGVFGGADAEFNGQFECGWLIGGRVQLGATDDYLLDLATEYQNNTVAYDGDNDDYTMVVGPRLRW